jgi:hypothetical protein
METRGQALLASVEDTLLGRVTPCDIHKLANLFKLRKACRFDGILKECFRHDPRILLVHLTQSFNLCLWLPHYLKPWKETKVIMLPIPG